MNEARAWHRANKAVCFMDTYSGDGAHFMTTPIWLSIWKENPYDYV